MRVPVHLCLHSATHLLSLSLTTVACILQLLDFLLGHDDSALFRRAQLKALVSIHGKDVCLISCPCPLNKGNVLAKMRVRQIGQCSSCD